MSHAATFGSSVRSRGILLEILARLPKAVKKSLGIKAGTLTLSMPQDAAADFERVSAVVSKALEGIETLPIIPREIQDILGITATERHRWLKDGRLKSAGTRTVRLRGRAREVTFHVFDPRYIEDLLDTDVMSEWREDDAVRKAENRRWAAEKRGLARRQGTASPATEPARADEGKEASLKDWAEFRRLGLLR